MDELDFRIIEILQKDGRTANASIARQVKVSEGTIRRRLRRLMRDGVINVVAVPTLEKMGYKATALVGLRTDPGCVDGVADALAKLSEVHFVTITTGAQDIFAWVALESSSELNEFLRDKVGKIPGVGRTETYVNLAIKKRTYGLVL